MKITYVATFALAGLVSASLQPRATNAIDHILDGGMSPKPTGAAYDLARALDPEYGVCGYIGGDPRYVISCGAERPCGFNDAQSWFGCCSSYTTVSGQIAPIGCSKALSCVPYSRLSSCTGSCASDSLVTRCTNSASGFCVSFALSTTQLYSNYICASASVPLVIVLGTTTSGSGIAPSGGVFSSPSISSGQFTRVSDSTTTTSSSSSTTTSRSSTSSPAAGGAAATAAPLLVLAGGALVALL